MVLTCNKHGEVDVDRGDKSTVHCAAATCVDEGAMTCLLAVTCHALPKDPSDSMDWLTQISPNGGAYRQTAETTTSFHNLVVTSFDVLPQICKSQGNISK